MERNEILNYENIKLCEAPPVAFINMEKKNYQIIYNNNFSIQKKPQCIKRSFKLKIGIESEELKRQDKKVLIDVINFIQRFCDLSLISTLFDLNGTDLSIKKDEKEANKYSLVLKDKNIKNFCINLNNNRLTDFYCPDHNKHFKTRQSLQNHCKAMHKFKCDKCGQLFGKKAKLENHLFYNCHTVKSNNNINQKEKSVINVFYININHPYDNIISENSYTKKEGKINIFNNKQFKKEKEYKNQGQFKRNEDIKILEESKKKQEEIIKKEEELKRQKESKIPENKKNSKENEDYYVCYIDGKEFKREKDYVNHFLLNHKNDYPFYCEICRKGFFSFQAIDNHNFSKNH